MKSALDSDVDRSMKLVTLLLPEAYIEGLDELVRENMYPSRSAAMRIAIRDLLKKELWTADEKPVDRDSRS